MIVLLPNWFGCGILACAYFTFWCIGFAFISMDDEQDAGDAIRGLDQKEFGRQGRRLRVDWTKQERGGRRPGGSRSSGNSKPTKTLFVINFDPVHTRTRDLEKHFDPYGKILSIRIRRNFAFVQYDSQEDATKALDATNMSKLMDQVVSVEYAVRDDDGRRNRYSPDQRGRDGSSDRGRYRGRSPSPHRRERDSPDYGHGPTSERSRGRVKPASPYRRDRDSPDYGRGPSPNTKFEPRGNHYQGGRNSDDAGGSPSPNGRPESRVRPNRRDRGSPSPSPNTRPESRVRPNRRDRNSPSPSPNTRPESRVHLHRRDRDSPNYDHSASPKTKLAESVEVGRSPNPNDEPRPSTRGREKDGPKFGGDGSPNVKYEPRKSSQDHGRDIPDLDGGLSPPDTKPEPRGRHRSSRKSPVHGKKYHSRSPSPHKSERQNEKHQKRELTNI